MPREFLWTGRNLVKTDFIPLYPNTTKWSTTHHVQVSIVHPDNNPDDVTGERSVCYQMMEQTHALDAKYPGGATIGIRTEFQEQVSRVHQVPCRQEA